MATGSSTSILTTGDGSTWYILVNTGGFMSGEAWVPGLDPSDASLCENADVRYFMWNILKRTTNKPNKRPQWCQLLFVCFFPGCLNFLESSGIFKDWLLLVTSEESAWNGLSQHKHFLSNKLLFYKKFKCYSKKMFKHQGCLLLDKDINTSSLSPAYLLRRDKGTRFRRF